MRFKLYFTLENPQMPIQYRKTILSYFKASLSSYNNEYYKKFYNEKDNIIKPYTYSIYFKNPKIEQDQITIEDKKFELNISVADYETGIILYNSFNKQTHKKYPLENNTMTLQNITMLIEKEINTENITIKFQAPLCVRSRQENKDYYYSYSHEKFEETLKINIKQQLKQTDLPETIVETFKITPINAKKTVIKFYEKQIECSIGTFNISGDKKLLEYLYKAGMRKQTFSRIRNVPSNLKGGAKLKVKVYLNEWQINAGIIGFLRILEHNKDNFAIKKENYIEFDTENLKNFHKYYFKYFYDTYNVAESVEERTKKAFEYIENNIEKVLEDKDEEKQRKETIKTNIERIQKIITTQLEKIKTIDEQSYNEMKETLDKIKKEKTVKGIQEIKNVLLTNIKKEKINKRRTLNKFRSELSKTYYGQNSFFQKNRAALTYEEQERFMYRDYISGIIETGFIHDIVAGKYNIEQIQKHIENIEPEGKITKEIKNIYDKIQKDYIKKGKELEEIQKYIKEKVIKRCCMCENEFGLTTNYSEGNFVPLAISSDNARNFFWNQNVKFPICDICKLMLFCISAGTTNITKTRKKIKDKKKIYVEENIQSFVNYDTNVETLLKTNNDFSNKSKLDNKNKNPYTQLILNIIEQEAKIGKWQLQNIFVVEFEAEYGAYSRIEYFNIKRYIAEFFTQDLKQNLVKITDYKYKLQIVDYILKNKDIKYIINERLRDEVKEKNPSGYNSFLATQTRNTLNLLKKERIGVEEIKKNNGKLNILYNLGIQIHEELKQNKKENKLSGYTYKMLNSIKTGNKKEFMDTVIRIHMSLGKDISPIFIETMQDTDLDFESIGHSFLSGLISNKYEKKAE